MTVSAIAPRALAPQRPCAAPQNPQPSAPPPEDTAQITLSTIDTPQKAIQLPVLNPVAQLALAVGVAGSAFSGMSGIGAQSASVQIDTQAGAGTFSGGFQFVPPAVSGGGLVDQNYFSTDNITMQDQSVHWTGHFGDNATDVTLSRVDDQQGIAMDGTVGQVEVHLLTTPLGTDGTSPLGLHTEGTLNGQCYLVDTLLENADGSPVNMNELQSMKQFPTRGQLEVKGNLKGFDIAKKYDLAFTYQGQLPTSLEITGGGQSAGLTESTHITVGLHGK